MSQTPEKTQALPTGVELTALDEAYRERLYDVLDRLRATEPVHRDRAFGRAFLTRHDDVRAALRSRDMGVDPRKAREDSYVRLITSALGDDREPSMLFLDDPDHKRLRGLVSQAFNPKSIEAMRPRIAAIADELLDAMADAETVDLIPAFAGPLPTIVIAEMLGVAREDRDDFKRWSDDVVLGFDPLRTEETTARITASSDAMQAYFENAVAERRVAPRDDLVSDLIRAHEQDDALDDREIVSMCTLLLTAGNVTTTDLIGNGVYALMTHGDQLAKLKAQPELIENAVEEMLRYDSPVTDSGRVPLHDLEIGGCPIEQGCSITTSLAAANHDPDVYPDPHRFDIEREDTHSQSFGGGVHICLGAPLARAEAQIGINALLARFPNIRLGDAPPKRRHLPSFRGFESLPVRLR